MSRIKAVIIDDGVYKKNVKQFVISQENKVLPVEFDSWVYSHGTACYDIFTSIAKDCELISIQAGERDDQGRMSSDKLVIALKWCLTHGVNLISLSIGTSCLAECDKYEEVLEQLILKNIIVIAAINNENKITFPASKKGILGVCFDKEHQLPSGNFLYLEDELLGIDIIVNADIEKSVLEQLGEKESNSYATPYMAGILCNIINTHCMDTYSVRKWLNENSFSMDKRLQYYGNATLSKADKASEPINIAIFEKKEELCSLGRMFRNKNYAALDMEVNGQIICRNTGIPFKKGDLETQYHMLCRIASPDIIFWFVEDVNVQNIRNRFFDCIIMEEDIGSRENIRSLLREEGEILSYGKGSNKELEVNKVFQDLWNLLT